MNLVFLNKFEKKENGELIMAEVTIAEENGVWRASWTENENRAVWYEGTSWSDLFNTFHNELKIKTEDGFLPLIASD